MRYRSSQSFTLTPVFTLIAINVAMFVITLLLDLTTPINTVFLLGLSRSTFLQQPWTIITAMFMHGSIWHILLNMLTLYYFGMYLSQLIGDKKLLLVYFAGGVLGNILFLLLAAPYSIAVGASGAIYALGGALVVMRPMLRVYIIPIPVPVPLWVVILLGFILVSPSVAWQAHLGGVIFGLIAGFFFRRQERTWRWR